MSIRVDHERKILVSSYSGLVTPELVAERRDQIIALNVPEYREIVDLTGVTEVRIDAAAMGRTAATPAIVGRGSVRVIVAPADWLYDIARTFEKFAVGASHFAIVRSMKEAEEFLDWSEK